MLRRLTRQIGVRAAAAVCVSAIASPPLMTIVPVLCCTGIAPFTTMTSPALAQKQTRRKPLLRRPASKKGSAQSPQSAATRELSRIFVDPEIEAKYSDLLGNQKLKWGRTVNVRDAIESLSREFMPEFDRLLAQRKLRDEQSTLRRGEQPFEMHTFLKGNLTIVDADGVVSNVSTIRAGMINNFLGTGKPSLRWHLNESVPRPAELCRRGIEGTGPAIDLGMVIGAINAGAHGSVSHMFDSEDAGPIEEVKDQFFLQQQNIKDVLSGKIHSFTHPSKKKEYAISIPRKQWPTIFHRVPGIHLRAQDMLLDGRKIPSMIKTLAIYSLNNYYSQVVANRSGIYFYVPKIETVDEATLVAKMLKYVEEKILHVPRGAIKIRLLNERGEFALAQEVIMFVLRKNLDGVNVGRWDYGGSRQQMFQHYPQMAFSDMMNFTMTHPTMKEYTSRTDELVMLASESIRNPSVLHGSPIGGMYAALPNNPTPADDEEIAKAKAEQSQIAIRGIWKDKFREVLTSLRVFQKGAARSGTKAVKVRVGYRQSWAATPATEYMRAGAEPLCVELLNRGTVEERIAPLQALANTLTPAEVKEFAAQGLVDEKSGKIIPKVYSFKNSSAELAKKFGALFTMKSEEALLSPPGGARTEKGLAWEIYMVTDYFYNVLAMHVNAAAIEDPNMANGYDGILNRTFSGVRIMSDHATSEGNIRALIGAVRHQQALTEDGETTKKGDLVTPELFLRLLRTREEFVKEYFDRRQALGHFPSSERAARDELVAIDIEIVKRSVLKLLPNGTYVAQPRGIHYYSRLVFSMIGKTAEQRAAMLNAVFDEERDDLVAKVASATTNEQRALAALALETHDYVLDVIPPTASPIGHTA